MTVKKPATAVQPPAAAVAQDAHWQATRDRLRARLRPTATLTICDDQDVKNALQEARDNVDVRKYQADTEPTAGQATAIGVAEGELAAAQEAFDGSAIVLRFQALPRPDFEALQRAHPPTEEQAEEGYEFNADTLAPELISAASLDGITPEDAAAYLSEWADGEAKQLYATAWNVQRANRLDLGKG